MKSILLFMCLLPACAGASYAQQQTGSIQGIVYTNDNKPAASVTVHLKGRATSTDSSGNFIFRRVQPGVHTIQVSLVGYTPITGSTTVEAGQAAQVNLTLEVSSTQLEE